jgi:hypothetical protein
MILRATCLIALFALLGTASPAVACGPGCHFSPSGACVRDGWEQGLPVRNECPAYARPQPPCGFGMRWDRQKLACFPDDVNYSGYAIGRY